MITFLYGGGDIHFLEHVIATLTLTTGGRRGDIQVELTSPQGTTSTLLPYRSNDRSSGSFINWPFMSVHYWGEDPRGQWMLTVRFRGSTSSAVVTNLTVTFYGTAETPAAVQRIPTHCDPACLRGCAAAGAEFCDACVNLRNAHTLECINQCPPGYVERKNYCYNSTLPEPHCDRHIPAIPSMKFCSGFVNSVMLILMYLSPLQLLHCHQVKNVYYLAFTVVVRFYLYKDTGTVCLYI